VSSTKSGLEAQAALQNALPKLFAKTPYKSVLYKKWPRSPSCPLKRPAKTPYKSGPETQAAL